MRGAERLLAPALVLALLIGCGGPPTNDAGVGEPLVEAPGEPDTEPANPARAMGESSRPRPGFVLVEIDGGAALFDADAERALGDDPVRATISTPDGERAVLAPSREVVLAYRATRDGFRVVLRGAVLWVFREADPRRDLVAAGGELAEAVAGEVAVAGEPVAARAPDDATLRDYQAAR